MAVTKNHYHLVSYLHSAATRAQACATMRGPLLGDDLPVQPRRHPAVAQIGVKQPLANPACAGDLHGT